MAFAERKKMGDKYRLAVTTTVLTYIDTAKQLGQDPMGLAALPTVGSVLLGSELIAYLGKPTGKAKDSVWWVVIGPKGTMSGYKFISDDLSKWRKQLNAQLKDWGQKSAVKVLRNKRAKTAGIVAAITVAVVVGTILTLGAAGAFTAAAAPTGFAAWAGGTAGTALTTAGTQQASKLAKAAGAMSSAASAGANLANQAKAGQDALPPELAAAAEADAAAADTHSLEPIMGVAAVAAVGIGILGLGLLVKGYRSVQ